MLDAQELQCVRGDQVLFTELSFAAQPGELVHIAGENGSGKTSLLRMLAGLLAPAAGAIRWNGIETGRQREDYLRALLYIGHQNALKDELSATENLRYLSALGAQAYDARRTTSALETLGVGQRAYLPVRALSQGQRRRVALARLLLTDAKLWLLDEPFAALDQAALTTCAGVIARHLENGGTVILTTHQEVPISAPRRQRIALS